MVVGRETHRWQQELGRGLGRYAVQQLMDRYREYLVENRSRSPFWQASHELAERINGDRLAGLLWSNVIKVDQDGECPKDERVVSIISEFPLLRKELRVFWPAVPVFFARDGYLDHLKYQFPGISKSGIIKNWLDHVACPAALPEHAYWTWHPAYLRFKGKSSVLKDIAGRCAPAPVD